MNYQIRSQVLKDIGRRHRAVELAPQRDEARAMVPVEAVARPEWYPDYPEVICETT